MQNQQAPQGMQQQQQQQAPQQQQQVPQQQQQQMPMQPMMGMPMPGMGGGMPGMPGMPMAMPNAEPEAIRNLMINYIPSTIDETQLRQLFEMYGPAESVKIVKDRETKASKGYGFVKYRFSMSALHATQYLNGYPLMNKRLKVSYANHEEAQKVVASYTQMPMANFAVPPRQ